MTLFEIEVKKVVDRMADVTLYEDLAIPANSIIKPVQFYWGVSPDMNKYLQAKGEDATPLIWSVTRLDQETEYGAFVRHADRDWETPQ